MDDQRTNRADGGLDAFVYLHTVFNDLMSRMDVDIAEVEARASKSLGDEEQREARIEMIAMKRLRQRLADTLAKFPKKPEKLKPTK